MLPRRSELQPEGETPAPAVPVSSAGSARLGRLIEVLPGLLTWLVVTSPAWAGLLLPRPFAFGVIAFDLFWLYLSFSTAARALRGYARMQHALRQNWRLRYLRARQDGRAHLDWDALRHIVIIPNYNEPAAILRRTLNSLAAQDVARQIVVVLAMEERERDAEAKARSLIAEFERNFAVMLVTLHPAGIPGEVVGKSSNESWAARIAKRVVVDDLGHDLCAVTISSCDADTIFHPRYFSCLSYEFATNPQRYRRFWQSPILLTNNIWEVPAPLRVASSLSGIDILANLSKNDRVVFPQSTYSLSLQMAVDVGYWDEDVIPEDWHMFLKCYYTFSGAVEVEPIYLPTGNDGVKAGSYLRSLKMAYIQKKRHAWGASDIPYAVRQCLAHREMPLQRRLRRLTALTANHLIWSSHWFLLNFSWMLPLSLANLFGVHLLPGWVPALARIMLSLCAAPYIVMILIDARLRPPRPASWRIWHSAVAFLYWWLIPVTSLLFSTLPALESQTRLMIGKRLEYRATEKA